MITHLNGVVIDTDEQSIVIDVHGIGYKVFIPKGTLETFKTGKEVSIWTHLAIRENAHTLYGFSSKDEMKFFELLISSVSGIGPKTGLGILNVSSVQNIRKAVSTGDTTHLTKVSGISKKMADKIVLELKGKFGAEEDSAISLRDEVDALEALKALGYKHAEAREALKDIDPTITDTGERVKKALRSLGK